MPIKIGHIQSLLNLIKPCTRHQSDYFKFNVSSDKKISFFEKATICKLFGLISKVISL